MNAIVDWASAVPRKEAPTSRMFANCMVAVTWNGCLD